jgi:hypothetical protein
MAQTPVSPKTQPGGRWRTRARQCALYGFRLGAGNAGPRLVGHTERERTKVQRCIWPAFDLPRAGAQLHPPRVEIRDPEVSAEFSVFSTVEFDDDGYPLSQAKTPVHAEASPAVDSAPVEEEEDAGTDVNFADREEAHDAESE